MRLLSLLVAAGLAVTPVAASPAHPDRGCAAPTSSGRVVGTPANDLCVYSGIPYAAAPVGDLRFRPPQPAKPWGTFQATDSTRVCPQFRDDTTEEYPDDKPVYTDEDCLRLNIWAPRTPGPHPVIVFSHGGAARFGTGNEPRYAGTNLARAGDAVVVTLNYRLGLLGWGELGGLDPSYAGSGNNGVRDQIAALEWVQRNIAYFGGDPRDVTAMGQSEGAFSLSAVLATDRPQRLFRRVILESGSGYMVHTPQLQAAFSSRLRGLTVDQLKTMNPADLLSLQEKLVGPGAIGGAVYFGPSIDGELVKAPLIDRIRAGNARGIDMMIGTNRDEMRFFAQIDPSLLQFDQERYTALFPVQLASQRDRMIATYQAERPGQSASDVALAMVNDQAMRVPATRLAAEQGRWARTYVYQFDWSPAGGLGAIHTAELPFAFGTLSFTGIPGGRVTEPVRTLSRQMVCAWTSFARSGDPGWPRYNTTSRLTRIWDTPSRIAAAPGEAERAAWAGYDFPALSLNF